MYLPAMDIVEHFFSRRLGLAMGLACCGSGFGQFVLAPLLYLTIGLLTGLGFGLMYLPAMDIVEHFFSRRLGLAMGLACCGSGFGQFVLAPLLHLATEHLGLTGTLYCLSATVAAAVFFALLYRFASAASFSYQWKITQ